MGAHLSEAEEKANSSYETQHLICMLLDFISACGANVGSTETGLWRRGGLESTLESLWLQRHLVR